MVVGALKHRLNRGRRSNLSFFRDVRGLECDLLYENGDGIGAVEVKSGATLASDWFDGLDRVARAVRGSGLRAVVYGGPERQTWRGGEAVPLVGLGEFLERLDGRTGERAGI